MRSLVLVLLAACGTPEAPKAEAEAPPEAPVKAAPEAPEKAPAKEQVPNFPDDMRRTGVVQSAINSNQYTIVELDHCGHRGWVAGPKMELRKGDVVELIGGYPQTIETPELNRKWGLLLLPNSWKKIDGPDDCSDLPKDAEFKPHGTAGDGEKAAPLPDLESMTRIGKLEEIVQVSGYTYLRLDICGIEEWIASPKVEYKVGDMIASPVGQRMEKFQSSSMKRSFDVLHLVPSTSLTEKTPGCPGE